MNAVGTRDPSEHMATARRLLKRRAAHGGELDLSSGLSAGMAFWTLEGLRPPLPPIGNVDDLPLPGVAEILHALNAAADHGTSVEEATTIARACVELQKDAP